MIIRRPRYDRIKVRLDKKERTTDARGYLHVWGTVVSANQFLTYNRSDGAAKDGWVEFVPESTVFDSKAMDTLLHAPITLHHPPEMLDTGNTDRYQVGSVIELKRDGKRLRALHQITARRAIEAIDEEGIFELSPGYTAEIDETPVTFNGRRADASQVGRIYNHHSIVPDARAGSGNKLDGNRNLQLRMDGLLISQPTQNKDNGMADGKTTYDLGDETFADLPPAIVKQLESLEAKVQANDKAAAKKTDQEEDDEEKDKDDKKQSGSKRGDSAREAPSDTASGETLTRAHLNEVLGDIQEKLVAANHKAEKERVDAAREREVVIEAAKGHLPQSFRYDGKDPAEIMYQAIIKSNPDAKPAADRNRKDSAAMRGMFDMLGTPKPEGRPIGGDGKEVQGSATRYTMDAAVKRRDARLARTQASFRSVGKIGRELAQHVEDQHGMEQGKVQ